MCLELQDHSCLRRSAVEFFGIKGSLDPNAQAARLADQFILQNRRYLETLEVSLRRDYDGRDVFLLVESGGAIGAVPLLSPYTSRPDYGLVVQPRFPWPGIGPMLAEMGWRVSPTPLRLPQLKRSERRVPPWVLSFMVLARLNILLDKLDRRFELTQEERKAPKGTISWADYARRNMVCGQFLSVPCRFPDLRDDTSLKGAIRFAAERQLRSLETQREQGAFVHRLIAFAERVLFRVRAIPARRPSSQDVEGWLRRPLRAETFLEGLQAIDWTLEERGLAGLSDLEGIPWKLPMDAFFEAWVETVLQAVAVRTGATVKVGRKRETTAPLTWDPPYLGSQKSLVPDFVVHQGSRTILFDAKYKRHWEEMQEGQWATREDQLRDAHRQDLLQVLAYANLADASHVTCCLVYPCSHSTWKSLRHRGRLFHKADLPTRTRRVQVWLTAVPMSAMVDQIAGPLVEELVNLQRRDS